MLSLLNREQRHDQQIKIARHEAKYLVSKDLLPEIRKYIKPYCEADPNGVATEAYKKTQVPEYLVTTMQLDADDLSLFKAKQRESNIRFKLRVRYYGERPGDRLFLETKKKFGRVIEKSRAAIPKESWCKTLIHGKNGCVDDYLVKTPFKSRKEEDAFLEFIRLSREIGAVPVILIRYTRESYFGKSERYARVTIDRRLMYQPLRSWDNWGQSGRWISMDSQQVQNKKHEFSSYILELKTESNMSLWMSNLVQQFGLVRMGNCKYATAIWNEYIYGPVEMERALPTWGIELFQF